MQIRTTNRVRGETKGWSSRRLYVEDPIIMRKSVASKTLPLQRFLLKCIRVAYDYYGNRGAQKSGGKFVHFFALTQLAPEQARRRAQR